MRKISYLSPCFELVIYNPDDILLGSLSSDNLELPWEDIEPGQDGSSCAYNDFIDNTFDTYDGLND